MRVQTRTVTSTYDDRPVVEMLESRVMLSGALPMLEDLVDMRNTVVRIETDLGCIDIELFDVASPNQGDPISNTAANFLNYLFNGDIDQTFFHRLISGFVLQGGAFKISATPGIEDPGLREVETEDPIDNEFAKYAILAGTMATIEPVASVAARVFFPTGTNLENIEVGQWIQLPGVPGGGDNDLFEIENVSNDFVRVKTTQNTGNLSDIDWTFFPRVNVERTISMAKLEGDPNSATSQWFFNLDDNSENLDNQNSGFTAFARVVNDESWDVVLDIAGLDNVSFVNPGNPLTGALSNVPVPESFQTGDPLGEDVVINILNAEVLKASGTSEFYTHSYVIPEGYIASERPVEEVIKLASLAAEGGAFQIIFHYERGERDQMVLAGNIASLLHLDVPLTGEGAVITDPRLLDTPFSIEIQSTVPLTATLRHTDFGGSVEESFVSPESLLGTWGAASLKTWGIADPGVTGRSPADPTATLRPFLLWTNLSDTTATVTVTFYLQGGGAWEIQKIVGGNRRGGLEVFSLEGLQEPLAGIRVVSDQDIVVMLTAYESIDTAAPENEEGGYSIMGVPSGGANVGYLAGVTRADADESHIAFLNLGTSVAAVVTLEAAGSDGVFSTVSNLVIPAGTQTLFNLNNLPTGTLPDDEFITLRYRVVNTIKVAATFVNSANGDLLGTSFESVLSSSFSFADVRFNQSATGQTDVLSIYNIGTEEALVRMVIMFDDESQILPQETFTVAANSRLDIVASMFPDAVRTKMAGESSFSLLITGLGMTADVPLVMQYTHYDAGGAVTYLGSIIGTASLIQPGGGA